MRKIITVTGCDDSTVVEGDFTEQESGVLERVAKAVTANGGGCQPVMSVEPWYERGEYDGTWGQVAAR